MSTACTSVPLPPFPDVQHIVVLRPCAVGDFVFALPALAALRETYSVADITLLGRPWQADLLAGRPGVLNAVEVMPVVQGVGAPSDAVEDTTAIQHLLDGLKARDVDLAIQLYGGGGYSNPFVQRFGARHSVGMHTTGAQPLERSLPYVYLQNERLRLLEVVGLAGARTAGLDARLPLLPQDVAEAERWLGAADEMPWVVIQPGATDARRRWPADRFAAVADALAHAGARVAINGSPDERPLVRAVATAMAYPALDLAAEALSLSGLLGVLARSALLVSNDTGPLHLAQAVGTPSVGIYWFSNLLVSAPLVAAWHRHVTSWRTECPVCGQNNVSGRCDHDVSFVADVTLDAVRDTALALFAEVRASRSNASSRTA